MVRLLGVLACLVLVACGGSDSEPTATSGVSRSVTEHSIELDIQSAMAAFRDTSWFTQGAYTVDGRTVEVVTSLTDAEHARGMCMGVSGIVFANDHADWDLHNVRILGQGGRVLVERIGRSALCDAP